MKLNIFFAIFLLSSCTSFLIRQECDKINWYQHGQDVAMRGDRPANDEMVMKCRRAEADMEESKLDQGFKAGMALYCQPDSVYQTGKNGDNFNTEFCDTSNMNLLKKRHADGIKGYCVSGSTAGLSGKKYKNVCTAEQEKKFLPEYRSGRKKYLSSMMQNSLNKQRSVESDINRLSHNRSSLQHRLAMIPVASGAAADPYINERNSLNNQVWSLNSEINSKERERNEIKKEVDEYQREMATLD